MNTNSKANNVIKPNHKLVLGFHSSGKTTFIAALWHFLHKTIDLNPPYKLTPPNNREYLEYIWNRWIKFKEVGRTEQENFYDLTFNLYDNQSKKNVDFSILDVSGEIYNISWQSRSFDDNFHSFVQRSNGALLFINPLTLHYPNTINEAYEIFHEVFLKPEGYSFDIESWFEDNPIPWETSDWDADESPSQVKIIELLQFLLETIKISKSKFRLAIIISAWDSIGTYEISPELWTAWRLPLLIQYLITNFQYKKNFQFFGISAQGLDYSDKDLMNELKQKDASERVIVVGDHNRKTDIFEIIKWIMS